MDGPKRPSPETLRLRRALREARAEQKLARDDHNAMCEAIEQLATERALAGVEVCDLRRMLVLAIFKIVGDYADLGYDAEPHLVLRALADTAQEEEPARLADESWNIMCAWLRPDAAASDPE